ncbi:hypothetical protein H072_11344 [Dactylellina haptotyla CBS 200.50]|uniref:Uncharacterized protein n=1 Tax=Dactylellina haptotyla (strain CBS 200.50) TaxID=1284197 RepID=S8B8D9_DACHA|nr:hypothetical protein H072_11344 [Dactylellina haptotyla CBS 200.50]
MHHDEELRYSSLENHKHSLRRLFLWFRGCVSWFNTNDGSLLHTIGKPKIDFSSWPKLEELALHYKGQLPDFYPPKSLKFLSLSDPDFHITKPIAKYIRKIILTECLVRQVELAGSRNPNIQAVVIVPYMDCFTNERAHIIMETQARIPEPADDTRSRISIEEITDSNLHKKFPEFPILRPQNRSNYWIDGEI